MFLFLKLLETSTHGSQCPHSLMWRAEPPVSCLLVLILSGLGVKDRAPQLFLREGIQSGGQGVPPAPLAFLTSMLSASSQVANKVSWQRLGAEGREICRCPLGPLSVTSNWICPTLKARALLQGALPTGVSPQALAHRPPPPPRVHPFGLR